MERFGLGDRWTLLYDGGREVAGRRPRARWSSGAALGAAAQRDGLPRRRGDPRRGAAARLPRHRPRVRPDVARSSASPAVRGPRPLRHGRRAHRRARLRDPDLRDRLGDDQAAGGAVGVARRRRGGGERFTSVASWRGPFGPIEYGGRTYGLRVHEFRRFLELPGAHRRARSSSRSTSTRPTADDLRRLDENGLDARRSRARRRATRGATATTCSGSRGRADDRQEPLRRHAQRLVQRSQRLLPGERPAGARPGHRARRPAAARRGAGRVQRRSRRRPRGRRRSSATTSATAARPARSPRSTSPPSGCCRGCSTSSGSDERRRRRRRARQQAGQRAARPGCG